MGGTTQRCMSRGSWRAGFLSGSRLRAYALSAELNTIASARTLAETFGPAGPRPPDGRALTAPALGRSPPLGRAAHATVRPRIDSWSWRRRGDSTPNYACMREIRPAPASPQGGRDSRPPTRAPASALRRARPPPSDGVRAPPGRRPSMRDVIAPIAAGDRVRGSASSSHASPSQRMLEANNLEFGAPVQRRLVQGVGTTSSGRALPRTDVPRRSYSTSSS